MGHTHSLPSHKNFYAATGIIATPLTKTLSPVRQRPVTGTLLPLAAIDDIIGVVVFFSVISVIGATHGGAGASPLAVIGMVLFPFVIGIFLGFTASFPMKTVRNDKVRFCLLLLFLLLCIASGLLTDYYLFGSFTVNYLLTGMAFSATVANLVPEQDLEGALKLYNPILNLSLVIVT